MKVSRLFTIDVEIVEILAKHSNKSGLVNQLLKDYFEISSSKKGILEQKRAIFGQYKHKIKEIRKEIKVFSEFSKLEIDSYGMRWLKGQKEEPSIIAIREYIKGRMLKNTTEQYLKGWKMLQEHGVFFEQG